MNLQRGTEKLDILNAGIGREIPEFISAIFERAINAGYVGGEVAAIVKVLR
jgi:hypothetical protein